MKRIFIMAMALMSWLFTQAATSVAISPTSVVITNTSPAGNVIKPLTSCYFAYKSGSSFQVFDENNRRIFNGDIDDATFAAADTTDALKEARLANYCFKVRITSSWYYYFPKGGDLTYTATGTTLRLKQGMHDFTFQIDSIYAGATDTTTALKLTYLKNNFNRVPDLQLFTSGGAATVAAGAAAGSSPTVSVSGNGVSGTLTVTTGTSATTGVLATITLPVSFPNGCRAVLTPADSDAAAGAAKIFVTTTASTVVVNVGTAALTDATQYLWNYTVTGY